MPRKVVPRVYVEEPGSQSPAITGAGTSTAAFVGPTLSGPTASRPTLLTSYADFESRYGGPGDLRFAPHCNFIAHGVRAFFAEGGTRLYVARVAAIRKAPTLAGYRRAFKLLAGLPDVSVVAAPGATEFPAALADGVVSALVAHAGQLQYRFAVLDVPAGQSVAQAGVYRGKFDSPCAALYYPWVVAANPASAAAPLTLPPSAFVCGFYARMDASRGVFKAPAGEPLSSALGLESNLNLADQNTLNALGVNCLRSFPGHGYLVWGARTVSSDSEWKYVSVRRYCMYLEQSLQQGTQWTVFEPNAEPLWASVRTAAANFLHGEWLRGGLLGDKPESAYFVKCDRTTMTQNDIDDGRLICLVGFAPLLPAEFVLFRIGQKTAGAPP